MAKLSKESIESHLGCSMADYLHVRGKVTVSEALQSPSFQSVQLTPSELEQVSLHQNMEPRPLPRPPQNSKLRCGLCQEEFDDYDKRSEHYIRHTSGDIPAAETTRTFPCSLCPAVFSSVEERRERLME